MTQHYSIVVERETNGTFSAWVAGVPGVFAAADTGRAAKLGIRRALAAHLDALSKRGEAVTPHADVVVVRYDTAKRPGPQRLQFIGLGALMGRKTSAKKRVASRQNGLKGGRPRKAATA
jgi:predicted RNase H-like HicB family nuclease